MWFQCESFDFTMEVKSTLTFRKGNKYVNELIAVIVTNIILIIAGCSWKIT